VEIEARELRRLASEVDERHNDAMSGFRDDIRASHAAIVHSGAVRNRGRRRLLAGLGAGGAVLAAASMVGPAGWLSVASAQTLSDEDLAAFAQSVELAAVAAYGLAAPALTPATRPVGELFAKHHQDHADAFGAVAMSKAVSKPNAALVTALTPSLQAVTDETSALELAFVLENQAAATYAFGLTAAAGDAAIAVMATILPIESEHAAVLGAALGKPVPDIFVTGAFESASVGDGTDPTKGIDPARFPVS
jgi:rubrerythrin